MLALLSTPLRRWLLATLMLPVLAAAFSKIGSYLQRRNGGAPTLVSRVLLRLSSVAHRFSAKRQPEADDRSADGVSARSAAPS